MEDSAKQNGLLGFIGAIRRDLVYAVRMLIGSPGFAAVGVLSLGLGIGVTTVIFSEINALILHDLPLVPEPDRLVMTQGPVAYPYFEEFRKQHDLFSGTAAYIQTIPFGVTLDPAADSRSERVFGQIVSPEYFPVMGIKAARGRLFSPESDHPGDPAVVVVSERFWRERLNSNPAAVGRTLRVNGQNATIVGIGPKDFLGIMPIIPSDIFIPTTAPAKTAPELSDDVLHQRDVKAFSVVMRLAPGVGLDSAEAALDTITRHLDESSLNADRDRKGRRIRLNPAGKILPIAPELQRVLWGLWGTLMGLILTIACMNLANMLLARAGARRREIAIRLAIGASRFRLIRQMLTESVLLALCGGAAGLVLTYWLTGVISTMKLPLAVPFHFDIRPDWHVLIFTFVVSLVAGIGFGLAPALTATKADVAPTLRESGVGQMRGYNRFGLRNLLVVWQVAGSLMLLLITGFIVLGYSSLSVANVAFDPRTMYLISIDPVRDGYSPEHAAAFFEKLPERLRNVAAVREVSLAMSSPFTPELAASVFTTMPSSDGARTTVRSAAREAIGAGYFAALNEPVLAGREFNDRDQKAGLSQTAAIPVILSQTAAKDLFGNDAAVGHRIRQQPQDYDVIGVVPDLKGPSIADLSGSLAAIYVPLNQRNFAHPPSSGLILMVRTTAGSDAVEGVRREIASLDPNLTIFNIRTLAQALDDMNGVLRLGSIIYGSLGFFGLILASIGLAGVTAYAVTQRRKEIGIRMALGAQKGQVLRLVLREGTALVAIGSVIGFAGAVVMTRAMSSLLSIFANVFRNTVSDPKLILGAPLLLAGLAMLACYVPARRSTQIDPLKALREQ